MPVFIARENTSQSILRLYCIKKPTNWNFELWKEIEIDWNCTHKNSLPPMSVPQVLA